MIIHKKRAGNYVALFIDVLGTGLLFVASMWGLISDRPMGDKVLVLPFLAISVFGL